MPGEATLSDWLEIIGLKATIDDLLAGKLKIAVAETAARLNRDVYPNVSVDWLEIVGIVDDMIAEAGTMARRQFGVIQDVLSIPFEDLGIEPNLPDSLLEFRADRLLTAAESRAINEAVGAANNAEPPELDDLGDLADDLEAALGARAAARDAKEEAAETLREAIDEANERGY